MGLAQEALSVGIFKVLGVSPERDYPWSPQQPTYAAIWERPQWEKSIRGKSHDTECFRDCQAKYRDLDDFAVYALEAFREWMEDIRASAAEMFEEADSYEEGLEETDDNYEEVKDWIKGTRMDAWLMIAGVCDCRKMLAKIRYRRPPIWRRIAPNRLPDYF
jgi:hypothetical protein